MLQRYPLMLSGKQKMKTFGGAKNGKYENFKNENPVYSGKQWNLNPNGRIKRTVWKIPTKPFKEAHFAIFPEALVEACLDPGCSPEGTVLDPFMGSGTTGLVALKNNRQFIGIELNPQYIEIANKRLIPYTQQEKLVLK